MTSFLQNNGAGIGLGLGLLPQLLGNLFGNGGNYSGGDPNAQFPAGSDTAPSIGSSYTAPNGTSGYAGGGPSGITNVNQQNLPNVSSQNNQNNNTNQLGGLQGLMSALNSRPVGIGGTNTIGGTTNSTGVSGLGGGIQTIAPAAVPNASFGGGGGPNMALMQSLQSLLGGQQGQAAGAPPGQMLGPAGANPMMQYRPVFR